MSRKTGKPTYTKPTGPSGTGRLLGTIGGLVAALLVGVLIGTLTAQPSGTDAAVAELRRQEAARDTVQITELTARARDTATAITPVIEGLAGTGEVDDAQLAQWRQAVAAEVAWFAKTVSGTTATNVARGGLRNAVEQLSAAVETYAAARALPASSRQPVLAAAARQRELAVMAWSVAATQLDQVNVDAGHGHQHVYLEIAGISGLMAGDSLPEGTGH